MKVHGMAIIVFPLFCAACLAGAAPAPAGKEQSASFALPVVKKDCTMCHTGPGAAGQSNLKKQPSELCLDCHAERKAPAEHQVDVAPTETVKGLPLTNGKIVCTTCHDPHRNPYGALLRMKPKDLCTACHKM